MKESMTKSSPRTPKRSQKRRATLLEQLQKLSTPELKALFLETNKSAAAAEWKWMQWFAGLPPKSKAITAYFEPVDDPEDRDEDEEIENLRSTEKNNYIKSIARLKRKCELYS